MKLERSEQFKRDFAALPEAIQRRAEKQLTLFTKNPRHPSLRVGKLTGHEGIFYGRITQHHRFTFAWKGDTVVLRRIGPHEILKTP
jgi:mRNA-degrading endonuclease YafQ of YafQ-DinJ toxin-antitoxin module